MSGFVFSSPYFRLALRPPAVKVAAGKLLARVIPWLPMDVGFDAETLTSDEELQRWTERDPLYGRKTTPGWFVASNGAQLEVLRRAPEFTAPLLVLAGGADGIADVSAARAFVDAAGSKDKRLVVYDGFRHEIFNEVRREQPIGEAVAWIEAHAG